MQGLDLNPERSGRDGLAAREGVGFFSPLHGVLIPPALLVEQREPDHADVARLAMLLVGIRALNRAEPKRSDRIHALPEAVDLELAMGVDDVAPLREGGGLAVEHVEAVDREDALEAVRRVVLDDNRIALARVANHDLPASGDERAEEAPALVLEADGDRAPAHAERAA